MSNLDWLLILYIYTLLVFTANKYIVPTIFDIFY